VLIVDVCCGVHRWEELEAPVAACNDDAPDLHHGAAR
jgi:hypothetical protein